MKTTLVSLLFIISPLITKAQTFEKKVDSKIKEVTVFLKGAQLTREVNTQLIIGKNTLKITGLSPEIDAKSIRIKGNENFKIVSVNHHKNFIEKLADSDEYHKVEKQIEEISLEIATIENENAIWTEKEQFLKSNRNITSSNQSISPANYKELTEFYSKQIASI